MDFALLDGGKAALVPLTAAYSLVLNKSGHQVFVDATREICLRCVNSDWKSCCTQKYFNLFETVPAAHLSWICSVFPSVHDFVHTCLEGKPPSCTMRVTYSSFLLGLLPFPGGEALLAAHVIAGGSTKRRNSRGRSGVHPVKCWLSLGPSCWNRWCSVT